MKKFLTFLMAFVCLVSVSMAGCSDFISTGAEQDVQKTPLQQTQEYVSSIDSHAAEISKKADEYIEAIGKSDSVAAKLKFAEITTVLDECVSLEIPDAVKSEGEQYRQACSNLKDALSGMNDIANGNVSDAEVQTKAQDAQDKYEKAVKSLKDADQGIKDKLDNLKSAGLNKSQV